MCEKSDAVKRLSVVNLLHSRSTVEPLLTERSEGTTRA